MLWQLFLFVVIGFLAGAGARLLIPRQQPREILITTAWGLVGALLGGVISWIFWPLEEGELYLANFVMALVGAFIALGVYSVYPRRKP